MNIFRKLGIRVDTGQSHLLRTPKTMEKPTNFANIGTAKRSRIARYITFLSFLRSKYLEKPTICGIPNAIALVSTNNDQDRDLQMAGCARGEQIVQAVAVGRHCDVGVGARGVPSGRVIGPCFDHRAEIAGLLQLPPRSVASLDHCAARIAQRRLQRENGERYRLAQLLGRQEGCLAQSEPVPFLLSLLASREQNGVRSSFTI